MRQVLIRSLVCTICGLGLTAPEASAEVICRYWFDSDTDLSRAKTEQLEGNSFMLNIDTSALPYGLHQINVMAGASDKCSAALSRLFYKPAPVPENVSRKLIVNVDGVKVSETKIPAGTETVAINGKDPPTGLHRIDCMTVASTGETVTTGQKLFYKPAPVPENVSRKLIVNVDGVKVSETKIPAGTETVAINGKDLPTGLHRIDCMTVASTGETVTTGQKLFYKPAPETRREDWTMTFFVNGKPMWVGDLPTGEDVVMLDIDRSEAGIHELVCLLSCSETGESYVAEKKDFFRPYDTPNSITGYLSAAGSEFIGKEIRELSYTLEFENGSEADAAPVNTIGLNSVLDPEIYDLATFSMREVKIGGKSLNLDGRKTFHERIDLRPGINAIADVALEFDESTGSAMWSFSSLNPDNSQPTDDKALAILPSNSEGRGMAEVIYDISLRDDLADGMTVENAAIFTFDGTETASPVWRNVTDYTLPESRIESVEETTGGYEFEISGTDTGSGIWKYELYQKDETDGSWSRVMTDITDTHFVYLTEKSGTTPRFATVAIDRAGNVEISDVMNSAIESIMCDPDSEKGAYYMLNGMKAPEGYDGIRIGKNRKMLKTNHAD